MTTKYSRVRKSVSDVDTLIERPRTSMVVPTRRALHRVPEQEPEPLELTIITELPVREPSESKSNALPIAVTMITAALLLPVLLIALFPVLPLIALYLIAAAILHAGMFMLPPRARTR